VSSGTIFMFSGQGSQYFQMGRPLYGANETFRDWMNRLDSIVRRESGVSVIETVYADANAKSHPFDRTLLTHPAIFMVEYSLAQALMAAGVSPDMVLGASLGSFVAAAVGGFLEVENALLAVIRQARVLEERCEPGGMTAVLADPALFAEEFLSGHSELAAINFATHFVVSARRAELAEIEMVLKQREIAHQRLPVSFAFHSQWIEAAEPGYVPFLRSLACRPGQLPLVCCDRAEALSELPVDYFWDIVRHPIRFRETTARLEEEGGHRYIDVGPAGTLATFLKYGLPQTTKSTIHAILTPFGADEKNFAAVVAAAGH
jgi:bacillaene synthase trans-acting acyltransferase